MRLVRLVLAVYLAAVLTLTLWPALPTTDVPQWADATLDYVHDLGIPLSFGVLEGLSNVVMFVPFGVLVPVVLRAAAPWTWRRAAATTVVAAAVLSAAIETAQLVIPGRVSTVQDVALNTLGAVLGTLVVARVRPRRPAAPAPARVG